jgi:putative MFS transporter
MSVLLALTAYAFYVQALGGLGAPFVAREFGLDDASITWIAGWISLGTFGTALLTRLADRRGRRGIVVLCFAGLPPLALASALAPGVASYTLAQLGVNALLGALLAGIIVVMTERASDSRRAAGQAWFGLVGALGAGPALALAAGVDHLPWGWRSFWALAVLPALAIPAVRGALTETERFEHARDAGRVAASRLADLFRGAWRRRSIGLLAASFLRPIALIAIGTWPYYHMVNTLSLSPARASLVFLVGGGVGQVGNPIGARLSNRWGRRPTSALGSLVAVATGIWFFRVATGPFLIAQLIVLMALCQAATAAFSVSDRLIGTELFPTQLRASFGGISMLMQAAAAVASQFGLSLLSARLGGLAPAITWLSLLTFVPATAVFLLVVPETRGLSLEQASLEDQPVAR